MLPFSRSSSVSLFSSVKENIVLVFVRFKKVTLQDFDEGIGFSLCIVHRYYVMYMIRMFFFFSLKQVADV